MTVYESFWKEEKTYLITHRNMWKLNSNKRCFLDGNKSSNLKAVRFLVYYNT